MKSLVLYYSHSGNTARIAYKFQQALQSKGSADLAELCHSDLKRDKIRHLLARFFPAMTALSNDTPDLSQYDIICLGSPVWAGRPAPLALKLLSRIQHAAHTYKYIVYFQVYGVKYSSEQAIAYLKTPLSAYGSDKIKILNISLKQAHDEQQVSVLINQLVEQIS